MGTCRTFPDLVLGIRQDLLSQSISCHFSIALFVAGFNRYLNTSNVGSATVTFTEAASGTLNASASTEATYALAVATVNAASISQIANRATITLIDDDFATLTLDYSSDAASTILNIGSADLPPMLIKCNITEIRF